MLKVCDSNVITHSPFWQGMSILFDVKLPAQLGDFKRVYDVMSQHGSLIIPDYIASDSENNNTQHPAFILTKMISGNMVEPEEVNDAMVKALAQHLSQLHGDRKTQWGRATQPSFTLDTWSARLQHTITILAQQHTIPEIALEEALIQAQSISPDNAVVIMPDLRWDQFLKKEGKLNTLVDLDAIVYAPKELELVLLEYILTPAQARIFSAEYTYSIDLENVRKPYRLLLFLMNVLGEQDYGVWNKREKSLTS